MSAVGTQQQRVGEVDRCIKEGTDHDSGGGSMIWLDESGLDEPGWLDESSLAG